MSKIAVIDTETTGLKPEEGDRIVQLAAVRINDGVIDTKNTFSVYLNPDNKKIPKTAFDVHGLSDEFLKDKPLFKDVVADFFQFIQGYDLVFYNSKFDVSFIQYELARIKSSVVMYRDYKTSCLMMEVANTINEGRRLKLDQACRRYGIDISQRKVHGALVDSLITAELYIKFHDISTTPLPKTPHRKPQTPPTARPIPRAFKHPISEKLIQLNHCKNPSCANYLVPAKNPNKNKDGSPKHGLGNQYKRLWC